MKKKNKAAEPSRTSRKKRRSKDEAKAAHVFWNNLIRAVEAEPHDIKNIRGLSGIDHPIIAAGLDDVRRRLIVISLEHDARSAALAQADIQAALGSLQIVMARPVLMNTATQLKKLPENADLSDVFHQYLNEARDAAKNLFPEEYVELWRRDLMEPAMNLTGLVLDKIGSSDPEFKGRVLQRMARDPVQQDAKMGIGTIPIYEFSASEIETVRQDKGVESMRELLTQKGVLQYFFPAPDQLALGLVERGNIINTSRLIETTQAAPNLGHPFGSPEIVTPGYSVMKIIDELQDRKLIIEGETALEITPEGNSIRQIVKFRPREGLVSKLIKRFSFNFDLKNLFGPGGGQ